MANKKSILILYHFFYPDDVVSARHFSDFAEGLAQRGWKVTVLTSNRYCRYKDKKIDQSEEYWMGIKIIRSYRPSFDQSKNIQRLINTLWLAFSWILQIMKLDTPDVIVLGSDPQFSQFLIPVIRLLKKKARLVYWCYDLYPEAIIASRISGFFSAIMTAMKKIMKFN